MITIKQNIDQLIPKNDMRVSFNYSSQNLRYCG